METAKDLLKHLASIMQKLDEKKITVDHAKAVAALVKQSNNLLRYELDVKKFEYKLKTEAIKK